MKSSKSFAGGQVSGRGSLPRSGWRNDREITGRQKRWGMKRRKRRPKTLLEVCEVSFDESYSK